MSRPPGRPPAPPAVPRAAATPEFRLTRAGEYVLGVMRGAERADFERALTDDAALQRAVADWEARLLPLNSLAEPAEPSEALWRRIDATVSRAPLVPEQVPGVSAAAAAAAAAAATRPRTPARSSGGWWNSLGLWRGLATAGFAAALMLAVFGPTPLRAPDTRYVVVLVSPEDKSPAWLVQAGGERSVKLIPLAAFEVPESQVLQLWTLGKDWRAPVSLGLIARGPGTREVALPELPPLQAGQMFLISQEPAGGSPFPDKPTGPIRFSGPVVPVI